jgi:hypothetical protein
MMRGLHGHSRWLSAAALAAVAVLAGCGSTAPSSDQTIGPLNESLAIPGFTLAPGAPTATTPTTTVPGSVTPTTVASHGHGATSLPTTVAPPTAIQPSQSQGTGAASAGPTPTGGKTTATPVKATGPITVGFLTTATSNASAYGASNGNTVSESGIDNALVNALNKQGGIDGRQIKLVFAHTDTGGSDWAGEFQAACATFTQDNHVDVVLGYAFDYAPGFESCLAKEGIPHISDSYAVTSQAEMAQYPLYWSLDTPPIEQREMAKYEGAMKTGVLTPSNKLGVILDTCAGNQAAWQDTVLPFLQAHHINVAPPFTIACGTGQNAGLVSTVASLTNVLLRFRSEGVNRISFETAEGPALLLSSIEAQTQGYHPDWIVSSLAGLAVIGGETPIPQMQHTYGFGWVPSEDVLPQYAPTKNAAQRRCLSLLHSQKSYPKAAADYVYAYDACEAVFLYADALKRDGGATTGTAVSQAIASIGTAFQSTLNLDGRSDYSAARHNDAPLVYKPLNWDGNCHCFRYGSQTFTMPG